MGAPTSKLRSWKGWILAVVAAVAIAGIAFSIVVGNTHLTQAQRITRIESQVKCPSCDGISALDSNTAGAFAVRSFVASSVKHGKSDSQIIAALEASYGPSILMTPPASSGGMVMTALPFVFVAVVLVLVGFYGFRRKRLEVAAAPPLQDVQEGETPAESNRASEPDLIVRSDEVADSPPAPMSMSRFTMPKVASLRRAWPLYLGIVLLLGGITSGILIIQDQRHGQQELAKALAVASENQAILKARVLANQGQDVEALKLLSSVLKSDPNQPVALAYQGWLLRQAGEKDKDQALINQGQLFLEKSVRLDPGYPDARVFLGLILYQDRHDLNGAVTQFKAFLADHPDPSFIKATKSVIIQAYRQAGIAIPQQLSS